MTRDSDLKALVRRRMAQTGENYTAARAALLAERATDPSLLVAPRASGSSGTRDAADVPVEDSDAIGARAEHERLLRPFLRDGRIVRIPARRRPRFALLLELLARFAPGETFSETEVGEILGVLHEDVAFWRRELVDYGLLERDGRGTYWVTATVPTRTANLAQEATAWERVWLPAFLVDRDRV